MIREIINFVKDLERDYHEVFELNKTPSPGLHLWVELDKEGNWKNNLPVEGVDYVVYDGKNKELSHLEQKAVIYQEAQDFLTMNKQQKFDMKQKIHSSSPFAISFNFSLNDNDRAAYGILKKPDKDAIADNQRKIVKTKTNFVSNSLKDFFINARKIILEDSDDQLQQLSISFENCYPEIIKTILAFKTADGENLLQSLKEKNYVRIYLKNANIAKQKELHETYVAKNIFNKDVFNVQQKGQTYGVADFMTTFATKKPFLSHKTSFFIKDINTRLTNEDALKLSKFQNLVGNKVLPNPLPIFIDKSEFKNNSEIVSIFNKEGERKFTYPQLLKKFYENDAQRVLGNYYLLNVNRGVVNDFDFVSNFQYKLNMKITNLFEAKYKEILPTIHLHTIFGFENIVVTKIFNNSLVKEKKGEFSYNYFNDIDPNYVSGGDEMANLIMRFRKAFYDYIYKSRKQAITTNMFDEIMWVSVISDIRRDEFKDSYHTKDTSIKEKLNIWFSLRNLFNNNKNSINMVNQTVELTKKLRSIIKNDDEHILTDEELAFASGQVIYKLLLQSESSNKTHAMLEPFLQKKDIGLFKSAILKTYETYKHAFKIYPIKYGFDKIMGEVLGAKDIKMNMRNFMTLVIAGFFSPSIFKETTEDSNN